MSYEFNMNNYEESTGGDYKVLPAGEYEMLCDKMEMTTSKAGDPMLKATFIVLGGEFDGRLIFDNYLLTHKVGQQRVRQLGEKGFGLDLNAQPDDFVGKQGIAVIKIKKEIYNGEEKEKNVVSYWKTKGETPPPATQSKTKGSEQKKSTPWG